MDLRRWTITIKSYRRLLHRPPFPSLFASFPVLDLSLASWMSLDFADMVHTLIFSLLADILAHGVARAIEVS